MSADEGRFQLALNELYFNKGTDKKPLRAMLDCIEKARTLEDMRMLLDDRDLKTLADEIKAGERSERLPRNETVQAIELCLAEEAKIK